MDVLIAVLICFGRFYSQVILRSSRSNEQADAQDGLEWDVTCGRNVRTGYIGRPRHRSSPSSFAFT